MCDCPKCAGSGAHPDTSKPGEFCPLCAGSGVLVCNCGACHGTAEVIVGSVGGDYYSPPEPEFGACRNARAATEREARTHRSVKRLLAVPSSW